MVMIAPIHNGRPNKIFSAVADPSTSWMSDPIIASSVIIQSEYRVDVEYAKNKETLAPCGPPDRRYHGNRRKRGAFGFRGPPPTSSPGWRFNEKAVAQCRSQNSTSG